MKQQTFISRNQDQVIGLLMGLTESLKQGDSYMAIRLVNKYRDVDILSLLMGRKTRTEENLQLLQANAQNVDGSARLKEAVQVTREIRSVRQLARQVIQSGVYHNPAVHSQVLLSVETVNRYFGIHAEGTFEDA